MREAPMFYGRAKIKTENMQLPEPPYQVLKETSAKCRFMHDIEYLQHDLGNPLGSGLFFCVL